ncbi:MAG: sugar phosphate isomerase/epimerase [Phycisphaeraceae bacterium]|nr:sugar phosphate isomerase/epimerase [Phycisphaeraceae bacterium]
MSLELSVMGTAFKTPIGTYGLPARMEMLAELGIRGYHHACYTAFEHACMADLAAESRCTGVEVVGVSLFVDLSGTREDMRPQRTIQILNELEATRHVEIALSVRDGSVPISDPRGDDAAVKVLEQLLEIAERRDLTLGLYPHCNDWLERFGDGLRLVERLNHPRLGCVFCGFHWYYKEEARLRRLREQLSVARSTRGGIKGANLCGSTRSAEKGGRPTIEPLGQGDLDNLALLTCLSDAGYDGWIDLQGYSVGGDVYAHLRQSRDAFAEMVDRLGRRPAWGRLWEVND